MPKPSHEVVGFSFQEIPLEEALNVVLAGHGNYSDVKQTLLEKLPLLEPGKAFAFGLPNGKKVPEESRQGLCTAINATLKRAKLEWRITYSGVKKMFICVPRTIHQKSAKPIAAHRAACSSEDQKVLALRAKGLTAPEIAGQVSMPAARVKYLVYQIATGRKKLTTDESPLAAPANNSEGKLSTARLVGIAKSALNYSGDFSNGDSKAIRKAISVVGVNLLKMDPKELAPLIGISKSGVYFNARNSDSQFGSQEIKTLQKAVKQEG